MNDDAVRIRVLSIEPCAAAASRVVATADVELLIGEARIVSTWRIVDNVAGTGRVRIFPPALRRDGVWRDAIRFEKPLHGRIADAVLEAFAKLRAQQRRKATA